MVFLGTSRVMWLHYFGMIRETLSESTDNLLLQTLEVLFLSFYYSRNWNLIYRSCLRASYRSEGRGERKQKKNVPWPPASPFPPSLSLTSRGWFENSLLYWFLPLHFETSLWRDYFSLYLWNLLWCDHLSETSSAHPHGTTYLVRCSDVWVCGWNPTVTTRMKPLQQHFPMVLFI